MKSIACLSILLIIFVASSLGAISSGYFYSSRYPGKCKISETLILSPGDIVQDPNQDCGRILCGGRGYAEFHTCVTQSVKGCTLGDYLDKSLPYPGCCKRRVIC